MHDSTPYTKMYGVPKVITLLIRIRYINNSLLLLVNRKLECYFKQKSTREFINNV